MRPRIRSFARTQTPSPRLQLTLSGKRRQLLKEWLENAMHNNEDPKRPGRFLGQTHEESAEVKHILDDIYSFCCKGNGDANNDNAADVALPRDTR